MEASLNLLGVCFATVKELFLLYLSSLKACGPAIQYPKLAGNRGRGRGGIHGQNSRLMKDQKKKKKKNHSSSAHCKPIPEIYSMLRKAALRTADVSFPLTLRTVFSCQITTHENTIIRIKKETNKKKTLAPEGPGAGAASSA